MRRLRGARLHEGPPRVWGGRRHERPSPPRESCPLRRGGGHGRRPDRAAPPASRRPRRRERSQATCFRPRSLTGAGRAAQRAGARRPRRATVGPGGGRSTILPVSREEECLLSETRFDRDGATSEQADSRESERLFRTIVETTAEGVLIGRPDGVITYVNPRMADMLGYSADDLVGMSGLELLFPGWEPTVLQNRAALQAGRDPSRRAATATQGRLGAVDPLQCIAAVRRRRPPHRQPQPPRRHHGPCASGGGPEAAGRRTARGTGAGPGRGARQPVRGAHARRGQRRRDRRGLRGTCHVHERPGGASLRGQS